MQCTWMIRLESLDYPHQLINRIRMCVHVPEYGIYSFVFYDYPVFIFIFTFVKNIYIYIYIYLFMMCS